MRSQTASEPSPEGDADPRTPRRPAPGPAGPSRPPPVDAAQAAAPLVRLAPALHEAVSAAVDGGRTPRVLVTAASKHGATAQIAERIAAALRAALPAAEVDVCAPRDVTALERYDAVVLGSAVYAGRWLDTARTLAVKHSAELARVPVWLFSSGPVGDPLKPREDPVDAAPLVVATGAREHAIFAGKLDRHHLRFAERAVATALRAPDGDFRDWAAIDAWAGRIARELKGV